MLCMQNKAKMSIPATASALFSIAASIDAFERLVAEAFRFS